MLLLKINQDGLNPFIWPQFTEVFKKYFLRHNQPGVSVAITNEYILLSQGKDEFFALNIKQDSKESMAMYFNSTVKKYIIRVFQPKQGVQLNSAIAAASLLKRFFPEDIQIETKTDFTNWIEITKQIEESMQLSLTQLIAKDLVSFDNRTSDAEITKAIKNTPVFTKKPIIQEKEKDYILIPDDMEISDEERKFLSEQLCKPLKYSWEIDLPKDMPF